MKMLEMKKIYGTERKNVFDGCRSCVNKGKKRISKLVNRLTEITQTKTLRKKKREKREKTK